MSTGDVSPFHSSTECTTAHVSRRNYDDGGDDELISPAYSATSSRQRPSIVTFLSNATPLSSDAFATPMTRPPTEASTTFAATPATPHGARRLGSMRPPGISILTPSAVSPLPSPSSHSERTRSADATMPPPAQRRRAASLFATNPVSSSSSKNTTAAAATGGENGGPTHASAGGRERKSMDRQGDSQALDGAAAASYSYIPPSAFGSSSPTLNSGTRRALSSPLVPTTRGPSAATARPSYAEGSAPAGSGLPARRALPSLPPLRPPSTFFAGNTSKSNSRDASPANSSAHFPSPTTAATAVSSHSSMQANAPPLPPPGSSVAAPTATTAAAAASPPAEPGPSWWSTASRFFTGRREQANAYLESLVNPGAVNLATENARTAAAQARSNRASMSAASTPMLAAPGGRHSRTASNSSAFDGDFDANRTAPPPRPPSGPVSHAARTPFEPFSSAARQTSGEENALMPLDVVVIDPASEAFRWNDPRIQAPEISVAEPDAANDLFIGVGDVSASDPDDMGGEPNTYVVDLLSALRGYLTNPTEPFGHLVAAALASRSAEVPVRGYEVAAAEHNPFLVRMIVDSGTLEVQDAEAQRNVQDTVDELIPATEEELNPAIYDYLRSFFKMPFVRLSHGQYALLKRSGFEYIKLMYDHQHVLPDEPFHSILINESSAMHVIHIVFMAVQLLSQIFCTVTIALVLASWMKLENNNFQSYGFYTLIVFGGGWALYLIFIIYAVRSMQDPQRFEPQEDALDRFLVPSPYVAVVPVIPLFDIMCLVSYCVAVRRKRMIVGHNIVACSRLSAAFYAVWFAFPQLIVQLCFNNVHLGIGSLSHHRWADIMLLVAVVVQWGLALLGYIGFIFTHDSIDGHGFACFNLGRVPHLLERHNAAAHTLHFIMAFVLETNVYLVTVDTNNRPIDPPCYAYSNVVLSLSSFSVVYILVVYIVVMATDATAVRISFSSVFLLAVQLALYVCSERVEPVTCATYRTAYFRGNFIFGYLAWGAYATVFVIWLLMMVQWCILCSQQLNLFPRVLWPYARRDRRFIKAKCGEKTAATTEEEDASQVAAAAAAANGGETSTG